MVSALAERSLPFFVFPEVLGIEPMACCLLGKCFTTELYHSPQIQAIKSDKCHKHYEIQNNILVILISFIGHELYTFS